jgi:hypothetical protein
MENAKPMATPLETGCYSLYIQDVITKEEEEFMKNIPYKSATGSLMYLVMTSRPDIAQAVSVVSQYTTNPRTKHWSAVKRIFCYLRGTMQEGLRFKGNGNIEIIGYCDSDLGGDKQTRKSRSRYVFMLANAAIIWRSTKQKAIAQSSAEAEYMAANEATKDAIWLRHLLDEMGILQKGPMKINCDSQSCMAMTKNPEFHEQTKHTEI